MNTELVVRVQHARGRTQALDRLLPLLVPLPVAVVTDDGVNDPNPLRNYLRCLESPPLGATHVAVIQDDTVPCQDFHSRLLAAVDERPDDLISLFVAGISGESKKRFLHALKQRERWSPVYMPGITHVVALVWPVATAAEFLDWFPPPKPIPGTKLPYRSDDMVVGHWAKITRRQVWATVPCLVEHPDDLPSVAQTHRGGDGKDRGRRAVAFAD